MKRTQLLVASVLALGLAGVAQASPFPADAEASAGMPGAASYSGASSGSWSSASAFPADAEASYNLPAISTHAERHAADAISPRVLRAQASVAFKGNLDD